MLQSMRVLCVIRQSSTSDDAASPDQQQKSLASYAEARGWTVVGPAVDLDTSASVPPEERPELGAWLANPSDFDALAVWRLDRLARSTLDFSKLLTWSREHRKTIVSVTEGFDLSTPVGEMVAQILMVFAQFELRSIEQRAAGTREYLRKSGRWPGGRPPYGYRPVKRKGEGWTLEHDPDAVEVLREIAARLIAHESPASISHDLNERGVPSPDRHLATGEEENRGKSWGWRGEWVASRINKMLTSYAMRGFAVDYSKGRKEPEILLDDEGEPVSRGPAILDAQTFRALRSVVTERQKLYAPHNPRSPKASRLLHHVAFCAECKRPAYYFRRVRNGVDAHRWRCQGKDPLHRSVSAPGVPAEELEQFVTDWFLRRYGHWEWKIDVWDPGEDHTAAAAEIRDRIDRLETDRYVHGMFADEEGGRRYARWMEQLTAERDRLESLPSRPAGYSAQSTGRTFAEEWNRRAIPGRAELLRSMRVRADLYNAPRGTPTEERVLVYVDTENVDLLVEEGHDDPLLGE